jgi:hypothetical protein
LDAEAWSVSGGDPAIKSPPAVNELLDYTLSGTT